MPKKIAKKIRKVIIAEVPKAEAPAEAGNQIAALASLVATPGWALIVKILNENITYLERAILTKQDTVSQALLSDAEIEILRIKRSLNIDLRDFPKNYQAQLETGVEPEENFDPYFKSNEEIQRYKNLPPPDDNGRSLTT